MATLSDKVKAFIVQGLATYQSPTQVSELVKNEFGIEVSRQQVATYDPTKHTGQNCAKKWKELFFAAREKYQNDFSNVAISVKTYRLEMLQTMVEKALKSGNMVLASNLIEQASKEVGGAFTNKTHVDTTSNGNTTGNTVVNNFTDPMAASQFYQEFMGAK
jgi:hypothetical protein